jgi:VanZ family protein
VKIIRKIRYHLHHEKVRKGLSLFYILIIVLISILPINNHNSSFNNTYVVTIRMDYLMHAILFYPFAWFIYSAGLFRKKILYSRGLVHISGIFLVLFSECIQYFFPWRTFNINDLLANFLGLIIGFIVKYMVKRWIRPMIFSPKQTITKPKKSPHKTFP